MTSSWDGDEYQARFDRLAAQGQDMHGEATLVRSFAPGSVLDAGCGTGRVAIELARHGIEVVGVDIDASMLATARQRGPGVEWVQADLCALDLGRTFDVVVMAGNVVLFTAAGTQPDLVRAAARHVAPGGVLVAGFSTDWADRPYRAEEHVANCRDSGLDRIEQYSTWDLEPWTAESSYVVCVAGSG